MEHNYTEWPDEQLEARADELADLGEIPHNKERTEEIRRELGYVTTEIYFRYVNDGGEDVLGWVK